MLAKHIGTGQYWKIVLIELFLVIVVMMLIEEIRGL
jgi:hypothetical protein